MEKSHRIKSWHSLVASKPVPNVAVFLSSLPRTTDLSLHKPIVLKFLLKTQFFAERIAPQTSKEVTSLASALLPYLRLSTLSPNGIQSEDSSFYFVTGVNNNGGTLDHQEQFSHRVNSRAFFEKQIKPYSSFSWREVASESPIQLKIAAVATSMQVLSCPDEDLKRIFEPFESRYRLIQKAVVSSFAEAGKITQKTLLEISLQFSMHFFKDRDRIPTSKEDLYVLTEGSCEFFNKQIVQQSEGIEIGEMNKVNAGDLFLHLEWVDYKSEFGTSQTPTGYISTSDKTIIYSAKAEEVFKRLARENTYQPNDQIKNTCLQNPLYSPSIRMRTTVSHSRLHQSQEKLTPLIKALSPRQSLLLQLCSPLFRNGEELKKNQVNKHHKFKPSQPNRQLLISTPKVARNCTTNCSLQAIPLNKDGLLDHVVEQSNMSSTRSILGNNLLNDINVMNAESERQQLISQRLITNSESCGIPVEKILMLTESNVNNNKSSMIINLQANIEWIQELRQGYSTRSQELQQPMSQNNLAKNSSRSIQISPRKNLLSMSKHVRFSASRGESREDSREGKGMTYGHRSITAWNENAKQVRFTGHEGSNLTRFSNFDENQGRKPAVIGSNLYYYPRKTSSQKTLFIPRLQNSQLKQ